MICLLVIGFGLGFMVGFDGAFVLRIVANGVVGLVGGFIDALAVYGVFVVLCMGMGVVCLFVVYYFGLGVMLVGVCYLWIWGVVWSGLFWF